MGYWDKKEVKLQKPIEEAQHETGKREQYDNINYDALREFEQDVADSTKGILNEVDNLANDIARQKKDASDLLSTNYWCAIVFNNTKQKKQFLANLGYDPTWTFIQGKSFAKKIGVSIEEPDHEYRERGVQNAYKSRAREIKKD